MTLRYIRIWIAQWLILKAMRLLLPLLLQQPLLLDCADIVSAIDALDRVVRGLAKRKACFPPNPSAGERLGDPPP